MTTHTLNKDLHAFATGLIPRCGAHSPMNVLPQYVIGEIGKFVRPESYMDHGRFIIESHPYRFSFTVNERIEIDNMSIARDDCSLVVTIYPSHTLSIHRRDRHHHYRAWVRPPIPYDYLIIPPPVTHVTEEWNGKEVYPNVIRVTRKIRTFRRLVGHLRRSRYVERYGILTSSDFKAFEVFMHVIDHGPFVDGIDAFRCFVLGEVEKIVSTLIVDPSPSLRLDIPFADDITPYNHFRILYATDGDPMVYNDHMAASVYAPDDRKGASLRIRTTKAGKTTIPLVDARFRGALLAVVNEEDVRVITNLFWYWTDGL